MRLYIFWPDDQKDFTWLVHTQNRDGHVPNPPYDALICPRCGKFSFDDVFKLGFEEINPVIRARGDIFSSDEGFRCVNSRFRDLIEAQAFPGLAMKPIGRTGWFVVNVTTRFDVRSDVFQVVRGPCQDCGRPRETLGAVRHLGHLITRPDAETFFSTRTDRHGSSYADRDLHLTEGIVQELKRNKIKGGGLDELLSEEEDAKLSQAWQRGEKIKFPKGSRIVL